MNKIVETFVSIQGEGGLQGQNMLFVRWFGCNLECPWCDEPKHVTKGLIKEMSDEQIVNLALASGVKWVCLTGGEITMHDMNPIIRKLQSAGLKVQAESNGYRPENIQLADYKTCSPKNKKGEIPTTLKGMWDDVKLVVKVGDDAAKWLRPYQDACVNLFVQPCNEEHTINQANMDYALELIEKHPWVGLSPQTHKLLEVE